MRWAGPGQASAALAPTRGVEQEVQTDCLDGVIGQGSYVTPAGKDRARYGTGPFAFPIYSAAWAW